MSRQEQQPSGSTLAGRENVGLSTNIIMWLLVASSGLFVILRVYCKFLRHRRLWWDDTMLIASWVALLVNTIAISITIPLGFGRHLVDIDPANLASISLNSHVAATFNIVAAVWSKTSFAMTLLRITAGKVKMFVWFVIITMNLAMGLSALFYWVQCNPIQRGWDRRVAGSCWNPKINIWYGFFAAAYSGFIDVVLALLSWKLVISLQMKRREKIGVALAMSMGIFAGATAFVKCSKIPNISNADFTVEERHIAIWGAAEGATTIMAASIPTLRALIHEVKNLSRRRYIDVNEYSLESHAMTRPKRVVVAANPGHFSSKESNGDDRGDKSLLYDSMRDGKIVQTQEIAIEFHRKRDGEDERDDMA